jgi:hypothetical protein
VTSVKRPPAWVGHITLRTNRFAESAACLEQIGLRPIARGEELTILELRGGTHLLVFADESAEPGDADFDLMVEDLEQTHSDFRGMGLDVTDIVRGRNHRSFVLTEPGGNRIVFNSTHVEDHGAV